MVIVKKGDLHFAAAVPVHIAWQLLIFVHAIIKVESLSPWINHLKGHNKDPLRKTDGAQFLNNNKT